MLCCQGSVLLLLAFSTAAVAAVSISFFFLLLLFLFSFLFLFFFLFLLSSFFCCCCCCFSVCCFLAFCSGVLWVGAPLVLPINTKLLIKKILGFCCNLNGLNSSIVFLFFLGWFSVLIKEKSISLLLLWILLLVSF